MNNKTVFTTFASMKTKEWAAVTEPNTLLIGESSMLQWSDDIIDYVMFLDYYFRPKPFDLGERSRYSEAKNIFDMIATLTHGVCHAENLYATNLTFDMLPRAPKGKRLLIPELSAKVGIERISQIMKENPTIKQVFVMGMQANYHLQKSGFYTTSDDFVRGAAPRTVGLESNYYQPIDGKVFRKICCQKFQIKGSGAVLIPILPAKDYPLREDNIRIYEESYAKL